MSRVHLVAAVSDNHVIGVDNDLPWRLPMDLKWFKMNTLNGAVIMGRRTWESLPRKPLKNRLNIVVSRLYHPDEEGVIWFTTLDSAMVYAMRHRYYIYVIGGADIFKQSLPYINTFILTRVHTTIEHPNPKRLCLPPLHKIWSYKTLTQNGLTFTFEMWRKTYGYDGNFYIEDGKFLIPRRCEI